MEIEEKKKDKLEISVKQKKQIQHQLINQIIPHNGHKIWEINLETLEIKEAKFSNATYVIGADNKKEIIIKDNFNYVSALNKKNALKLHSLGKNGSKEIIEEPLNFLI